MVWKRFDVVGSGKTQMFGGLWTQVVLLSAGWMVRGKLYLADLETTVECATKCSLNDVWQSQYANTGSPAPVAYTILKLCLKHLFQVKVLDCQRLTHVDNLQL